MTIKTIADLRQAGKDAFQGGRKTKDAGLWLVKVQDYSEKEVRASSQAEAIAVALSKCGIPEGKDRRNAVIEKAVQASA